MMRAGLKAPPPAHTVSVNTNVSSTPITRNILAMTCLCFLFTLALPYQPRQWLAQGCLRRHAEEHAQAREHHGEQPQPITITTLPTLTARSIPFGWPVGDTVPLGLVHVLAGDGVAVGPGLVFERP